MPASFVFHDDPRYLELTHEPLVCKEEIIERDALMFADERWHQGTALLVSFPRGGLEGLNYNDIGDLVANLQHYREYLAGTKAAFIAPADITLGLTRMWHLRGSNEVVAAEFFRSREEGLSWLGLDPR